MFFAVDRHEGLDKEQIYKDIVNDVGGPDAFANRTTIDLPLYVYHDMDSCTAVSLKIWSTLQDAQYQNYVVKAEVHPAGS